MQPELLVSRFLKGFILLLALHTSSIFGQSVASKKTHRYHHDTIAYPLSSKFAISVNGSPILKDLEFWVYDANGVEVFYSIQTIPTSEQFQDIILLLVNREYKEWMMLHGYVMKNRRDY